MFRSPEIDDIKLSQPQPLWKKITFAVLLISLAVYVGWCFLRTKQAPVLRPIDAHTTAAVASLPPVTVPLRTRTVQALPKAPAAKRLQFADDEIGDDNDQIIQAVDIPPTEGGAVAVTFFNISSGKSRVVWKEQPRPFASFESGTEIGGRYGLDTSGSQTASIYIRRDLARFWSTYLSGYAEASTRITGEPRLEGKAMIDFSYRTK